MILFEYESKEHAASHQRFLKWYRSAEEELQQNKPNDSDDHEYWLYMAWQAGRKSVQDAEELQKENKALLMANMDLSNWFNSLKTDYDGLVKENNELRDSLDVQTKAADHWMQESCKDHNAMTALEEQNTALKEAANSYKVVRDTLTERLNALEAAVKLALDTLSEYANPGNWDGDQDGVKRKWLEPDSYTPLDYEGFELAQKGLTALKKVL